MKLLLLLVLMKPLKCHATTETFPIFRQCLLIEFIYIYNIYIYIYIYICIYICMYVCICIYCICIEWYTEQKILTVQDLRRNVVKMFFHFHYPIIYACNSLTENILIFILIMTAEKFNIQFWGTRYCLQEIKKTN